MLFWSYCFCQGHSFFYFAMGVTLDQYWLCIGLFNSFRVIKCSAHGQVFFIIAWNFSCFLSYHFSKNFLFSSINSVASEFHFVICFIAIASSCNRGILRPILELLTYLPLVFKQYLDGRLFQTLANFSLFKCPSIWYLLPYWNFFKLFDFVEGSETSNYRWQTLLSRPWF